MKYRVWYWRGKYVIPDYTTYTRFRQPDGSVTVEKQEHKDNAYWTDQGRVSMISVTML